MSIDCPASMAGFDEADKARAQRAWNVYLAEMHGVGFYTDFNLVPDQLSRILAKCGEHQADLGTFRARIDRLAELVEILEGFYGRPATRDHPFAGVKNYPDFLTHEIRQQDITTFRTLHATLTDYANVVSRPGITTEDILVAARSVAAVLNPEAWRNAGYRVPPDVLPFQRLSTRSYLTTVIHASAA